jgi:uncharacterized protein (TIGR00255 family)
MTGERRSIRGMTGFGRGGAERDGLRFEVEVKGVNHRFLDIKLRLPADYVRLEADLRGRVQKRVARGRVDITVNLTSRRPPVYRTEVRDDLVAEYLRAARAVKKKFRLRGTVGLEQALALPGAVLVSPQPAATGVDGAEPLVEAFQQALAEYDAMRAAEGKRLAHDVRGWLGEIAGQVATMRREAGTLPETYARRLRARVEAVARERGLDDVRLAQEVALLADRVDITEELVRLEGYLDQAGNALDHPPGPVGKSLDFVMQEMSREATTITSKAEALSICQAALSVRGAVEKIREQVQNIE